MEKFDLLAIGTGPAASRVAAKCVTDGWQVAIAEKREFGGTCALRGCNPKKVFVRAAELFDWAKRSHGRLVHADGVRIDWPQLNRFKRQFTDPIPEKSQSGYQDKGITTLHGGARFLGPNEVQIGERRVHARRIVIGTGARPATLDFVGHQHLITSDQFLDLETLPRRIIFVGGGYISFEFAHVAARADSQVTILDHGDRMLKRFSAPLVDRLIQRSRGLGMLIQNNATIESISQRGDGTLSVDAQIGGRQTQMDADLVVHGAGRVPNLDDLNLSAGRVDSTDSGVTVNEYLQSVSNESVYAVGDCADTGAPPLTPVANQEGRTVASNLLQGNRTTADYGVVPAAVFTVPALASVGLIEEASRDNGCSFEVRQGNMSDWSAYRKVSETTAAYVVLVETATDQILGAHLLGPDAAETINLFALAMKFQLTATDLKSVLLTFPTFASNVREMI